MLISAWSSDVCSSDLGQVDLVGTVLKSADAHVHDAGDGVDEQDLSKGGGHAAGCHLADHICAIGRVELHRRALAIGELDGRSLRREAGLGDLYDVGPDRKSTRLNSSH